MPVAENLTLRVNGIVYKRVGLQYELDCGFPKGPFQAVIKDDRVAPFPLTDDFIIELGEDDGNFRRVTLAFLITLLQSYKD